MLITLINLRRNAYLFFGNSVDSCFARLIWVCAVWLRSIYGTLGSNGLISVIVYNLKAVNSLVTLFSKFNSFYNVSMYLYYPINVTAKFVNLKIQRAC